MTRWWCGAVAVAAAMSGCLAADANGGELVAGPTATPAEAPLPLSAEPWTLTLLGCRASVATVPVDEAAARERLPVGWEPKRFLDQDDRAVATFSVLACARGLAPDLTYTGHVEGFLALPATPSPEFQEDGIDSHAVLLAHAVPSEEVASWFAERAVSSTVATIRMSESWVGTLGTGAASVECPMLQISARTVGTVIHPPPTGVVRYHVMDGDAATSALDAAWTEPELARGGAAHVQANGEPLLEGAGIGASAVLAWRSDAVSVRLTPLVPGLG